MLSPLRAKCGGYWGMSILRSGEGGGKEGSAGGITQGARFESYAVRSIRSIIHLLPLVLMRITYYL